MKSLILVCDDEERAVDRWVARLAGLPALADQFDVRGKSDFLGDVEILESRRSAARDGGSAHDGATSIDAATILIVDFDLLHLSGRAYVTGETVAYLARCYSGCQTIVVLNQFGENPFDLTLRGHPASYADFNLGAKQIGNPSLWGGSHGGFHPWCWPDLAAAPAAFERRVATLRGGALDLSIVEVLGLPPEVVALLSSAAREFLEGKKDITDITFREFVDSGAGGLQRKDRLLDEAAYARVAAARVAKWCDRLLLADQDLIIDAPHLALRFPSLLKGSPSEIDVWDRSATATDTSWSAAPDLLRHFEFPAGDWTTHRSWFGRRLAACDDVKEVSDPWSIQSHDAAFCEDLSRFLRRDAVREFTADVHSPFVRRHVSDPDAAELRQLGDELRDVDYRPAVRFSL